MVLPTFFNLSLNLAIRSSWCEPQSVPQAIGGTITHICGGVLGRKSGFFLLKAVVLRRLQLKCTQTTWRSSPSHRESLSVSCSFEVCLVSFCRTALLLQALVPPKTAWKVLSFLRSKSFSICLGGGNLTQSGYGWCSGCLVEKVSWHEGFPSGWEHSQYGSQLWACDHVAPASVLLAGRRQSLEPATWNWVQARASCTTSQ